MLGAIRYSVGMRVTREARSKGVDTAGEGRKQLPNVLVTRTGVGINSPQVLFMVRVAEYLFVASIVQFTPAGCPETVVSGLHMRFLVGCRAILIDTIRCRAYHAYVVQTVLRPRPLRQPKTSDRAVGDVNIIRKHVNVWLLERWVLCLDLKTMPLTVTFTLSTEQYDVAQRADDNPFPVKGMSKRLKAGGAGSSI